MKYVKLCSIQEMKRREGVEVETEGKRIGGWGWAGRGTGHPFVTSKKTESTVVPVAGVVQGRRGVVYGGARLFLSQDTKPWGE